MVNRWPAICLRQLAKTGSWPEAIKDLKETPGKRFIAIG
jgi:hypothetical protein